ncbi:MAG: hypothetical protein ACPGN3_16355 [Opitutales bacterium]
MSDSFRKVFFSSCLLLGVVLAMPVFVHAQTQNLEAITRTGRKPIRIAVESTNSLQQKLAQQAFQLHGAFDVATPRSADWIVRLSAAGNQAQYTVVSSDGKTVESRGSASGGDSNEALRAALDAIVRDLTGTPGFFRGKLTFVAETTGNREVYVSDILFQEVRAVTNYKNNVVSPRWSPDGEKIIYTTYALTGYPDIVVQDLKKNTRTTVANYRGSNLGGRFSPDGRSISFVSNSSGSAELYISRTNGSGARRQTWTKGIVSSPTWSPDSKMIVFMSDDWGGPQLILLDPAKKQNKRLRTGMGGYNAEPVWNPVNPDLIGFTMRSGGEFQLALYSFKDGRAVKLTNEPGSCVEPAWLSDGRHIAFTYRYRGTKQLKLLDTQTGRIASLHSSRLPNVTQPDFVFVGR